MLFTCLHYTMDVLRIRRFSPSVGVGRGGGGVGVGGSNPGKIEIAVCSLGEKV